MGCDKRYGLREVWVAPEASPNTPAIFGQNNYLQHCTASNFPAVYRENLENQEATGNRGQSLAFDGAQAELSWDVTVMLPTSAEMAAPASLPESLQALFWAAGFGGATAPAYWIPGASGIVKMGMTAGSACGRTIQLIGLDRDKRQLELLMGAVVSQIVLTFSRTEPCTIQFSGVAAQKWEATAPVIAPSDITAKTLSGAYAKGSYDAALPTSPAVLSGVELTLAGESAELSSIIPSTNEITIKSDFSSASISTDTQSFWNIAKPSTYYAVLSPDSWSLEDIDAVQSATLTVETGQTYGELTTAAQYPTEILSGQVKVTANATAYLTDANSGTLDYSSLYRLRIYLLPGKTGTYFGITAAKLTESPAIDLSNVDTPASGDFSFAGGETGTFKSTGFLDTIFVN